MRLYCDFNYSTLLYVLIRDNVFRDVIRPTKLEWPGRPANTPQLVLSQIPYSEASSPSMYTFFQLL